MKLYSNSLDSTCSFGTHRHWGKAAGP